MNIKKICVLGLGYIGLPTASLFATQGFSVIGVDVDPNVVEVINRGGIHIKEPGLKTIVQAAINSGNMKAALKPELADVFIIAVPTPITEDKKADLSYVISAGESIVPYLKEGNLVVLESTSPPGTTADVLTPILERSGLKAGSQFFVAHCPERVIPGKMLKELIENSRVVGGINRRSSEMAKELYSSFVDGDIYLTDATTAEMIKLMENTFRDVNIALANELAIICKKLGLDAWEVLKLANLHPRVNIHNPGPGVGGHCISVDPWFIVDTLPNDTKLIKLCRKINDTMPLYVVDLILEQIKDIKNPKVAILGVSYKGNIDDTRESPAIEIIANLKKKNVNVGIYDPHVHDFDYELNDLENAFGDADCAVIIADHKEFGYLHPGQIGNLMRKKIIIDTRNCIDHNLWKKSGFQVVLLGCKKEAQVLANI